jgi:hypothetical protein
MVCGQPPVGKLPNATSMPLQPPASCSASIRNLARSPDFLIRDCANGGSSSCSVRFRNTSSFMKFKAMTFCCAAPSTATAICRNDWLNRRKSDESLAALSEFWFSHAEDFAVVARSRLFEVGVLPHPNPLSKERAFTFPAFLKCGAKGLAGRPSAILKTVGGCSLSSGERVRVRADQTRF